MRTHPLLQRFGLIVLILGFSMPTLLAQEAGETLIKRDPINHDFYAAGQSVHLIGPVTGDAVLAGRRLTIDGPVSGDIIAAGETVTINGEVLDDIRAAGRLVQINGAVGDHIVAAGETVSIGPAARVGGWAWLAGQRVEVLGQIDQQLKAAGNEVLIGGEIGGAVAVTGERVRILPGAVIQGSLRVQSPRPPEIADSARILGDVKHIPMPEVEHAGMLKAVLLAGLMVSLSLMLTGIIYYLLFPRFSITASRQIGLVPLASLGLGFAVLLLTPVVVMILFALGVGFLPGILLGAAYLLMVVLGGMTGVIYVSDVALRRLFKKETAGKGATVLALVGAFIFLALVQLIPLLGALAVLLLTVMGIGALKYQFWQQYRAG